MAFNFGGAGATGGFNFGVAPVAPAATTGFAFGATAAPAAPVAMAAAPAAAAPPGQPHLSFPGDSPLFVPDGIQSLAFAPNSNMLAGGCWDNKVRIWDAQVNAATSQTMGSQKVELDHGAPVLDVLWTLDGSRVLSAGADNNIKMFAPDNPTPQVLAGHQAPVRFLRFDASSGLLISGAWDNSFKCWDMRTGQAVHSVPLSGKVHAMDAVNNLLAVCTSDVVISLFDVRNPTRPFVQHNDTMKQCLRSIAVLPNMQGYVVAGIEGRVHVKDIHAVSTQADYTRKVYTFRAHRSSDRSIIYPINDIKFAPSTANCFATVGGDGAWGFWQYDTKKKMRNNEAVRHPTPISCCAISRDSSILAYGVSYDWSKGHAYYNPQASPNYVVLHCTVRSGQSEFQQAA